MRIFTTTLLLTFILLQPVAVFADDDERYDERGYASGTRVSLADLGLLQLAAHDLFLVDRDKEIDEENGKLDLSTVFDHGPENIGIGGEPRNRENIFVFSVAERFGEGYLWLTERGMPDWLARKILVGYYHYLLGGVYERTFGHPMPEAREGAVTMTENLALRTIHDLLPGTVIFNGERVGTVDHALVGKTMDYPEIVQPSAELDGEFAAAFLHITIVIPPEPPFTINLLEKDSNFADQFNTEFTFEHFLGELEDGRYDRGEDVTEEIRTLFAKGLAL